MYLSLFRSKVGRGVEKHPAVTWDQKGCRNYGWFLCLIFSCLVIFLWLLKSLAIILTSPYPSFFPFFFKTYFHCSPCSPWILEIVLFQHLECCHCRCEQCLWFFSALLLLALMWRCYNLLFTLWDFCLKKFSISRSWKKNWYFQDRISLGGLALLVLIL